MSICRFNIDNFSYNIESNLEAMGLPLPETVFGTVATMSGSIAAIESALASKASDMPLKAIAKSGHHMKQLAGISAAFYAGAIIGSAQMASKRATRCDFSELKESFKSLGLPSWAADDAIKAPNGDKLLRAN